MNLKVSFRNILAIVTVIVIFATVWGIGCGFLAFSSDLVKGMIIGGIMQWGAWIYMFYFRKKGTNQ